ncbi:MAG: molybdopterin molybdotransferase MoeA, partial [Polyangiaceae bacterium]|nr:molybdopterin molybdotransferase MoeA [Polyangiaceae bacterium]
MKEFFQVVDLEAAEALSREFAVVGEEQIPLAAGNGRVLAADFVASSNLPGFRRSTMDGYAVCAVSTFGASDAAPALLTIVGSVQMGAAAGVHVGPGQAVRILTGGMLPSGADAVVMIEHTEPIDDATIEVTRAVAPRQNVIEPDDDARRGEVLLARGTRLRPQELGLLAALGCSAVHVFARPVVAILSTGDEVVPVESTPAPGQIRDVNSYTLAAMVERAGAIARQLGIVADDFDALLTACKSALNDADSVLLSGGSSVGSRDLTLAVLEALPGSRVCLHGIAIKPGKPTILANVGGKSFWGLPGHAASAMVVFHVLVRHHLEHLGGARPHTDLPVSARLRRNVASVHGRRDYVRVRLEQQDGEMWAVPVLGKSGLLRPMVQADGIVEIGRDVEGLEQGA